MDKSSQSSASEYYTLKEDVKKKGKLSEQDQSAANSSKVKKKRYYDVSYQEDNVDGKPEEPVSRMEKYKRELSRTRQRMRKIPFIYLNTFDTIVSFLLISTTIWLARRLVN